MRLRITLACGFFLGSAASAVRLNWDSAWISDGIEVASALEVEKLEAHESPAMELDGLFEFGGLLLLLLQFPLQQRLLSDAGVVEHPRS